MLIETENELAALIVGLRLGKELELRLETWSDGGGVIGDGGCEGWSVSISQKGFFPDSAYDDQDEEISKIVKESALSAKLHFQHSDLNISEMKIRFAGIAKECLALGYSPSDIAFAGISTISTLAYNDAPNDVAGDLLVSCAIDDGLEHKGFTMQQFWDGEATKC